VIQLALLKPIGGWLLKNIVPVGIVLALAFSHWYAYDSGQDNIEKKYEAQREALIEENARLAKYNLELSQQLATKQTNAQLGRAEEKTQALVEANEYVRNNPHDPSCYVTESDADFLR
jgi:hypothetical protein